MARGSKAPALSLLWPGSLLWPVSIPGPGNFLMLWVRVRPTLPPHRSLSSGYFEDASSLPHDPLSICPFFS